MSETELTNLIKQLNLDDLSLDVMQTEINRIEAEPVLPKDGWVQVEGCKIIVHDPINGGELPVIRAVQPVKVSVNSETIEAETAVHAHDRIS